MSLIYFPHSHYLLLYYAGMMLSKMSKKLRISVHRVTECFRRLLDRRDRAGLVRFADVLLTRIKAKS